MKTLDDLFSLPNLPKTALVRVDYNITLSETMSDSELYRIECSVQTIQELLDAGIQPILVSHFGRKGDDISVIIPYIEKHFPVTYVESWDLDLIHSKLANLPVGHILLLPNSRAHDGEESNDIHFATLLSNIAPVYINEAFSASHRNHATITGVTKLLPHYAGRRMVTEIYNLDKARTNPVESLVIIGGAKFDTKMPLIEYYLDSGATVCVVGALAHPIYRARGYEIGQSFMDDSADVTKFSHHPRIWVADSVVVKNGDESNTKSVKNLLETDQIVDMGMDSVSDSIQLSLDKKTIIWNGPLGLYESGFSAGTNELVGQFCNLPQFRVLGGGDLLACVPYELYGSAADFCSTGGGAMLEYLYKGTLTGITALNE